MKIDDIVNLMMISFDEKKTFEFPINGTSMSPFLHKGDLVEVTNNFIIKKNDIIFYKRKTNEYVLHRVVKINKKENYYVLLGDHQIKKEFPIYENQIIGKVIRVNKKGKTKELKGLKYSLYKFSLKFKIIRRIYGRYL